MRAGKTNMNILAFDTCLDKMYVALSKGNEILGSKIVETTKNYYHSAFLISTIRDILKENDLAPQDINLIVTNTGPGSFTGIRACTTVARVFAQGVNEDIKTVGISSLEILSRLALPESPLILTALDARKEMAYVAIYENKKEIFAPQSVLLEELKELISKNNYTIVTDDKLEPILGGISYQKSDEDLGKILIEIAIEKINTGFETDWRNLHPLYIQPPPVTPKK